MLERNLSRRIRILALRARDPGALSLVEAYELYRADLARDLRRAEQAFRAAGRGRGAARLGLAADAALLVALLAAAGSAAPMQRLCEAWSANAGVRGLAVLSAGLIALAAWLTRRRLREQLAA